MLIRKHLQIHSENLTLRITRRILTVGGRRATMSMRLQISADTGFLRVRAMGKFSLVEAKRAFMEMLEAIARTEIAKVLFDGRGLEGNPEFIERFYYGEFVARGVASSLDSRTGFP